MNLSVFAAALPVATWDEIGRVVASILVLGAGVVIVLKAREWFEAWLNRRYVRRHEFEQLLVDSSRNQKLIDKLVEKMTK